MEFNMLNVHINAVDQEFLKFIDKVVGRCSSLKHVESDLSLAFNDAIKKKANLTGICVMHIKDWLEVAKIDINALKKLGVIVDLDSFNSLERSVQANYEKDPRNRIFLKLLKNGLDRLLSSWENDTIQNKDLKAQLDKANVNTLAKTWKKAEVQEQLQALLSSELEGAAEQIARDWLAGERGLAELDNLVLGALEESFITQLPKDDVIRVQVEKNEATILLQTMMTNQLTPGAEKFKAELFKTAIKEIHDNYINHAYEKGDKEKQGIMSAIRTQANADYPVIKADSYEKIVAKFFKRWEQGQEKDSAIGREIEEVVKTKLKAKLDADDLPGDMAKDILHQSFLLLFQQVHNSELGDNADKIEGRIGEIITTDIRKLSFSTAKQTRDALIDGILVKVLASWKKGELSQEQRTSIDNCCNEGLQAKQKELAGKLYLQGEVQRLSEGLDKMEKLVEVLMQKISENAPATNGNAKWSPSIHKPTDEGSYKTPELRK